MGDLNPFKTAKMPTPVAIENPVVNNDTNMASQEAERKRRALAVGGQGNIVSSLANAVGDAGATSKRTTLLGG